MYMYHFYLSLGFKLLYFRFSIRRIHIDLVDNNAEVPLKHDVLDQVYAVSCDGGNIKFFASSSVSSHSRFKTAVKLATVGLTGKTEIKANKLFENKTKMPYEDVDSASINLHINPVNAKDLFTANEMQRMEHHKFMFKKSKRLDLSTCIKEGIFFYENQDLEMCASLPCQRTQEQENDNGQELPLNSKSCEQLISDIVEDLVKTAVEECESTQLKLEFEYSNEPTSENEQNNKNMFGSKLTDKTDAVDMYSRLLIYFHKYDFLQVAFSLDSIKSLLSRLSDSEIILLLKSNISDCKFLRHRHIVSLLMRHQNSLMRANFFDNFGCSDFTHDSIISILISLCLYFLRGHYIKELSGKIGAQDVEDNIGVQIASCKLLIQIVDRFATALATCTNELASRIEEICSRCQLQQVIVECIVIHFYFMESSTDEGCNLYGMAKNLLFVPEDIFTNSHLIGLRSSMLELCLNVIMMEDLLMNRHIIQCKQSLPSNWQTVLPIELKYLNQTAVIYQPLLASIILWILKQPYWRGSHKFILQFVLASLVYLRNMVGDIVVPVALQICQNLLQSDGYDTEIKR